VRFSDNSVIKVALREERIPMVSPYGKLSIPVADLRKIEFGLRVPDEVARQIESAIAALGDANFRRREAATETLLNLREKADPAVVKAARSDDKEVARRAEELAKKFRDTLPREALETREFDVVHTEHSKISGRIESTTLKAHTFQFGDVQLKLTDMISLKVQ